MREWWQKDETQLDGAFKEIAFIRMPPAEFADRFKIAFTQGEHGKREMLSYAAVELRSGALYFLQHETKLSDQGLWLYGSAERDAQLQSDEFAKAFGIDPSDVAVL